MERVPSPSDAVIGPPWKGGGGVGASILNSYDETKKSQSPGG